VFALTELFGLTEHGIFEVWKEQYDAAKSRGPEPIGPKVEDTTPIPFKEQADAAKKEADVNWMVPADKPKLPATPVCDRCGNKNVRIFTEAWQCSCGASGKIGTSGASCQTAQEY
jgi:hypothetical protein